MRITRVWGKCYRVVLFALLIFIAGKIAIWTMESENTENNAKDRQTPQTYIGVMSNRFRDVKHGVVNAVNSALPLMDNEKCTNIRQLPNYLVTKKDTWASVDMHDSAYVLNAYYVQSQHTVFVIGAKKIELKSAACLFSYSQRNGTVQVIQKKASNLLIREGRNLRYSAHVFMCEMKEKRVPDYVSLVTSNCAKPQHLLPLQNASIPAKPDRTFTVCLSPLNYNYSRAYELVEWIELNRIMGAEKFIIYNHSSFSNIANVLDFYSKRGVTEVVQWRLPMKTQKVVDNKYQKGDIYYFGQLAALNDCLYRQKHYSEFVINLDVDEFIIPHTGGVTTWTGMIKHLIQDTSGYLFRNVFFRKDWSNDNIEADRNKEKIDKFRLITLQKFEREHKVFGPRLRSKYFARAVDAQSLMIHSANMINRVRRLLTVPEQVGLLHHYRNWQNYTKDRNNVVVDMTVRDKYSATLVRRVESVWSQLPADTAFE